MLSLENITKAYGARTLLSDCSVTVHRKERCALLGRNGSGKSTLLKIIAGKEAADYGVVRCPKEYRIGFLEQHIHFTKSSVQEEVLEANPTALPHEADALVCGLGVSVEQLHASPQLLSGGYQLRVQLAKALLARPDLLLLDEPTNYLDIPAIRFLERFLRKWPGEMIIVSHDRSFLDAVCTHMMGLHGAALRKEKASTSEFFAKLYEEEEQKRRANENVRKQKAHLSKFVQRFRYKASKAGQAQSKMKAMERLQEIETLEESARLTFHFPEEPHPGKHVLSLKNLCFSYGAQPLISQLSLEALKGEKVAIVGKNGCGKSTLLRLIAQELTPQSGHIRYSINAKVGYFGQTNIQRLNSEASIYDEVRKANPKLKEQDVRQIAGQMLFTRDDIFKMIRILSGGEKARVLLAKILAEPCNVLLLDEPSNHLDIESVEALTMALRDFGGTVFIVTHDEWLLRSLVLDKVLVCKEKSQSIFLGTYEEFLEQDGWEEGKKESAQRPTKNRKQRAEAVRERSERLRPIRAEKKTLEKEIATLEVEKSDSEKALIDATREEKGAEIQRIAQKVHALGDRLDACYERLEQLLQEEEAVE